MMTQPCIMSLRESACTHSLKLGSFQGEVLFPSIINFYKKAWWADVWKQQENPQQWSDMLAVKVWNVCRSCRTLFVLGVSAPIWSSLTVLFSSHITEDDIFHSSGRRGACWEILLYVWAQLWCMAETEHECSWGHCRSDLCQVESEQHVCNHCTCDEAAPSSVLLPAFSLILIHICQYM